ncbi:MAG: GntR family transcriptional regulator / MocR family aminotransferase [Fusobacteria bacterium]|nr:MAG: GntR family transcriptional regulator / MocR family aminotransferase [Fusobacteriota bacterium]KAF0230164.1 MAG: GntR family transcriptional regulator / MocR family [Fusobacteriota bacterium]
MEMLTLSFVSSGEKPLYHQLYEYIKEEIRSGRIEFNTKLPSKRKLSAYLNISQNTIQAAYDQLIEEGYIVAVPKKGFFVSPLDNILNLDLKSSGKYIENRIKVEQLVYDFSYHGVDHDSFPFTIWRRLIKEAINEYDMDLLKPGSSQGRRDLRVSIAKYLRHSRGVNCSPEQIVISSGTESLFQILIQLLGQEYIYGIENPGYEKLNLLFKSNNAKFKTIDIDMKGMKMEEIEKSGADILCITPAHQFPSGEIMPITRRIKILNWAYERKSRYIIEDDYDSEFKYSGKPIPALFGLDTYDKVIYMGSLSKSLSPSIRVSYMVLPELLLNQYREKLSFIVCPVPTIDQKVLQRFIEDGHFERHINRMRNIYKRKREVLVGELVEFKGRIDVLGADAGLHLLLRVNNGMSEEDLVDKAKKVGIGVYGISNYFYNKNSLDKSATVLLGYAGMKDEEIRQAISKLTEIWL